MVSKTAQPRKRYPLGNYGLSLVLLTLFLTSWIGQFFVQKSVVAKEAQEHGQAFAWSDFWPQFWHSTLENWQSEFLQLLTFVVLTAYLIHRSSHESRDADDEMQAALERIEAKVDALEGTKAKARS
jgi:hypothetical protein